MRFRRSKRVVLGGAALLGAAGLGAALLVVTGVRPAGAHAALPIPIVGAAISLPRLATPTAADDSYEVPENRKLIVPAPGVLGNDTGYPAGLDLVAIQTQAQHGAAGLDSDDGSVDYTPDAGFTGTDTFTYCITGSDGGTCVTLPATVTIHVMPAPVAHDDAFSTPTNVKLSVDAPGVVANDEGVSNYVVGRESFPAHGELGLFAAGKVLYTPERGSSVPTRSPTA